MKKLLAAPLIALGYLCWHWSQRRRLLAPRVSGQLTAG